MTKLEEIKINKNPTVVHDTQFNSGRQTVWRFVCTWDLVLISWLWLNHFNSNGLSMFIYTTRELHAITFLSSRVLNRKGIIGWNGQEVEKTV